MSNINFRELTREKLADLVITKAQFERYLNLQESGLINMFDVANGTRLSRLTPAQYVKIQQDYTILYKKYKQ